MWRRALSAHARDAKQGVRDLKKHVHRLYKHIHPDRLGQFPEHRAVNEASFKVLQSALQRHFDRVDVRVPNVPPQAFQRPQQLTFFTQPQKERASVGVGSELCKAVVQFHESQLGQTIHSLFEAVGLQPPPRDILPGHKSDRRAQAGKEFASLTDLVKHARHVIMTNVKREHANTSGSARADAGQARLDDEIVVTRLALQRSRGVSICLGNGLPSKNKLVLLFRRLMRTLTTARAMDLGNLVVEFDGGFDVSLDTAGAYPWLVLGACAAEEAWLQGVMSEQVALACGRSRRHLDQVRISEIQTAKALGLKLVMHNIQFLAFALPAEGEEKTESRDNLQRMLNRSAVLDRYVVLLNDLRHSATKGRNSSTAMQSLALMLEEGTSILNDTDQGVLRVGIDLSATEILEALRRQGPSTNRTFERQRDADVAEQRRVANVMRAVDIDGLRRGDGVSDREWAEALSRMRADAGRLRGVLDGVPVVVGTEARILEDSGEIEVPCDFFRTVKM